MPNIRDIAKACGVAPNTVSSALNNKQGEVSPETQERILRVVREMGYRPRARPHPGSVLKTLGVLSSVRLDAYAEPGYFASVFQEILKAGHEPQFNLLTFTGELFFRDPHQSVRAYCDGRCDGLIVLAPSLDVTLLKVLEQRGTPFVVLGASGIWPGVDVDNVLGGRIVAEHLLALGHRRIAFLGERLDWIPSVLQRLAGFRQACADHGLAGGFRQEIFSDDDVPATCAGIVRQWKELPRADRPTAAFCWHDGMALALQDALNEWGLRVPEDISLAGFDDIPPAALLQPSLTTVRQPYAELVKRALESLSLQISGGPPMTADILLPPTLIVRRSTAPLVSP